MEPQQGTVLIAVVLVAVDLAIRIAALIVIPRDRKPTAAMAWLLAILLVPYLGILFFLLIGSPKLPRKRRARQAEVNRMIAAGVRDVHLVPEAVRARRPGWFDGVVELNRALGAVPAVGGSRAELVGDYAGSLVGMTADIDSATSFVHVEFYIVSYDVATRDFFRAMEDAVARGVVVRLLLDHVASVRAPGHRETVAELDRIGVQWSFMLPVRPLRGQWQRPDLRNHRKLVVVDGRIGWMGSQNLVDRSYNLAKNLRRGLQWQDLMTRTTGPVVSGLNAVFLTDWYCETDEVLDGEHVAAPAVGFEDSPAALECQVVPSGPGFEYENNLHLFLALLYSARHRVIITSPYFVPDEAMMYAITSACHRGLEVHLFVSEWGDQGPVFHAQRSYYGALLRAGVRIFRYPAPFILHAKHLSIDDDTAVIGSSNMDIRSFALDLEVSLLVRGAGFVEQMRGVEDGYREISRELTLAEWEREPLRSTVLDGLARLTSALQ
ncbi:cardiolipin synthase [Micrococcus sp. TA1]|uniref:cardiolipin synthase n=1 Tax=Micrococcus sp. TA1 TaxID=681627 RepID=UPI00161642F7|nr:cardiolipin synthase [Micrococcus sp. TA1]MBB5749128.1 cardiolipin synthase [Micrococcus sp. TA1]